MPSEVALIDASVEVKDPPHNKLSDRRDFVANTLWITRAF